MGLNGDGGLHNPELQPGIDATMAAAVPPVTGHNGSTAAQAATWISTAAAAIQLALDLSMTTGIVSTPSLDVTTSPLPGPIAPGANVVNLDIDAAGQTNTPTLNLTNWNYRNSQKAASQCFYLSGCLLSGWDGRIKLAQRQADLTGRSADTVVYAVYDCHLTTDQVNEIISHIWGQGIIWGPEIGLDGDSNHYLTGGVGDTTTGAGAYVGLINTGMSIDLNYGSTALTAMPSTDATLTAGVFYQTGQAITNGAYLHYVITPTATGAVTTAQLTAVNVWLATHDALTGVIYGQTYTPAGGFSFNVLVGQTSPS
jgi:hypothetical protein